MSTLFLKLLGKYYAKQKQPWAVKWALPSKVESMLYVTEYNW